MLVCAGAAFGQQPAPGANPALRDAFTADPAPLVVGDTVYLYVGHDEARGSDMFRMNEWLVYSSRDMRNWTAHGPVMKAANFKWAVPRLRVEQFTQGYPSAWPGRPALASVADPFTQAPEPVGFNRQGGGASRIGQSFTATADLSLARISLYAGDGHGTDASQPLRLSLRELDGGAEPLGEGQGLALAYQPQGAGLLSLDLSAHPPVLLKAGKRYLLELVGNRNSLTIYLRASRGDLYADGEALLDGQPLRDKQGKPADFAFALYAR